MHQKSLGKSQQPGLSPASVCHHHDPSPPIAPNRLQAPAEVTLSLELVLGQWLSSGTFRFECGSGVGNEVWLRGIERLMMRIAMLSARRFSMAKLGLGAV